MNDILLGPELSALLDAMRDSIAVMNESRKVKPGGFLLSPQVHAMVCEVARRTGVRSDPRVPANELLGLPFRVIHAWNGGWILANNRACAELRQHAEK